MPELIKLTREPNLSCKLPENLDSPVWRYMDFAKFNSLLKEKALYLCRADRLQDRFEGTYSRHQVIAMEDWFDKINENYMSDIERENRRRDRLRTYLSCWCMNDWDLDLMWKGYVRNPPGVAIKSSVRRLKEICDNAVSHWPIDISLVSYFDHAGGENINYFGTPTTFLYKDLHFRLDKEIRIIHYPNISEPTPNHILLPVNLRELIECVVFQPKVIENSVKSAREALNKAGLEEIPVLASRDDREIIE